MQVNELKPTKQRQVLAKLGEEFIRMSKQTDDEDVKYLLINLIEGAIEPLAQDDFFGTEGWEHYFNV